MAFNSQFISPANLNPNIGLGVSIPFTSPNVFSSTYNTNEAIKNNFRRLVNDQVALNEYKHLAITQMLDSKKFYTVGNFFNNSDGTFNWDGVTNIIPPKEILIHHANYVVGVENMKRALKKADRYWG